ncbi:MAG: hypothetical protein WAX85_02960 [Minisyncoccia bacterium]
MNAKSLSVLISRIALFLIYFWFGFLKIIGLSPASGMVQELFSKTVTPIMDTMHLSFMTPGTFVIVFGVIEVIIGILFLVPGKEKLASILFFAHMVTTGLPLFFLKDSVWARMFVPTLEGQYIIKNIALIACALNIRSSSKS